MTSIIHPRCKYGVPAASKTMKKLLIICIALVGLYLLASTVYVVYSRLTWPLRFRTPERMGQELRAYVVKTGSLPDSLREITQGRAPTYDYPYHYRKMVVNGREYGFAITTTNESGRNSITTSNLETAAKSGRAVVKFGDDIVVVTIGSVR